MITLRRFRTLEAAVKRAGFEGDIIWAERLAPPKDADAFARAAVYVITNSGMKNTVAVRIFERCMDALQRGKRVRGVFGHPGKRRAIHVIWHRRHALFDEYQAADDKIAFCASLPWVGPVTSFHLAKDLGVDVAKPDVHLARLAHRDRTSVERMCGRLARQSGYRVATVDTILWRACEHGILSSSHYEAEGWRAAFRGVRAD